MERCLTPLVLVLVLYLVPTGNLAAQTAVPLDLRGDASYSYAVFIGTGWYKLDERQPFVLRIPMSWQLRELRPGQMGVKLLLPFAIGIPASHLGLGYRFGEHSRAIVVETKFPF